MLGIWYFLSNGGGVGTAATEEQALANRTRNEIWLWFCEIEKM